MPLSTDPKQKKKQIANLKSFVGKEGNRATKAMRFSLPLDLADKLEAMSKTERDQFIENALRGL